MTLFIIKGTRDEHPYRYARRVSTRMQVVMLQVVMLQVVMLQVVMFQVVMLRVEM